jgi:hypothetical protein
MPWNEVAACGDSVHYVQAVTSFRRNKGGHVHLKSLVPKRYIYIFVYLRMKCAHLHCSNWWKLSGYFDIGSTTFITRLNEPGLKSHLGWAAELIIERNLPLVTPNKPQKNRIKQPRCLSYNWRKPNVYRHWRHRRITTVREQCFTSKGIFHVSWLILPYLEHNTYLHQIVYSYWTNRW